MDLTDREKQIVSLLTLGYTNREIGKRLLISADTVSSHLSRIYQRTGAASRFDLAIMALGHELVHLDTCVEVATKRAEVNLLVKSFDW